MTDNEIIKECRKKGLNNGSAIGFHSGFMDIVADRFEELLVENERLEKENEEQYEIARDTIRAEIADHLLANGVIVPPCKVGDTLYPIIDMSHTACKSFVSSIPIKVLPYQIYYINVMGGISAIPFENFGKTVFLTREEAERELEKRCNNDR